MQKNIYVPANEEPAWRRAEELSDVSLSQTLCVLVKGFVEKEERRQEALDAMVYVLVSVDAEKFNRRDVDHEIRFYGCELSDEFPYTIWQTEKGTVLMHDADSGELTSWDSLSEFQEWADDIQADLYGAFGEAVREALDAAGGEAYEWVE